jgi:dipeptidyl aminopeptidase/acylaminoacyl peptidase
VHAARNSRLDGTFAGHVYLYEVMDEKTRVPGWIIQNWIPGVLAVALAIVVGFLIATCSADDGPSDNQPTPTGTITAAGRLGFISNDGNLVLINPDGTGAQPITEAGGVQRFAWSPDGSLIAVERQVDGGSELAVIRSGGEAVFNVTGAASPTWSPAGDRLLVERAGGLEILARDGQVVASFPEAVRPDWSGDGSAIAFIRTSANGNGVPIIGRIESREESPLDAGLAPEQAIYPVLWQPGGSLLAYRNTLYDFAAGTGAELPGIAARFSPDGRLLLVVLGADPTVRGRPAQMLDLTRDERPPVIGINVRPAPDGTPPWLFVRMWTDWGKDGRIFFYLDPDEFRPRVRIFDTIGKTQDTYRDIRGEFPVLSPDSTHVTFQYEGKVWVFPLNATALAPIVEGSLPSWQPRDN